MDKCSEITDGPDNQGLGQMHCEICSISHEMKILYQYKVKKQLEKGATFKSKLKNLRKFQLETIYTKVDLLCIFDPEKTCKLSIKPSKRCNLPLLKEKVVGFHFHHKGTFIVYENGMVHIERRGELQLHELSMPFKRATKCLFTTIESLH